MGAWDTPRQDIPHLSRLPLSSEVQPGGGRLEAPGPGAGCQAEPTPAELEKQVLLQQAGEPGSYPTEETPPL